MQALPHRYRVKGVGRITGDVELTAERLTMLQSERSCLISSSLKASIALGATVDIAEPAELKVPA